MWTGDDVAIGRVRGYSLMFGVKPERHDDAEIASDASLVRSRTRRPRAKSVVDATATVGSGPVDGADTVFDFGEVRRMEDIGMRTASASGLAESDSEAPDAENAVQQTTAPGASVLDEFDSGPGPSSTPRSPARAKIVGVDDSNAQVQDGAHFGRKRDSR